MKWKNLTATEIRAVDPKVPVLLPLAAVEQHGPHLPTATDCIIIEHFARLIDDVLADGVLILPTVAVACSRHHMDFGGTLTVSHETFIRYVSEILDSVAQSGFRTIVLFNGHGGNQAAGQVVVESWGMKHPETRVVMLTWWRIAGAKLFEITETGPGGVGHACEFETSLLLDADPRLVHTDSIAPGGNIPTYSWAESDMLRGAKGLLHRPVSSMTSNGVFGDPTAASAEKGRLISAAVIDELRRILVDLRGEESN